ncbi:DNA-binding response regulator [Oceaniferula spumae]|uniref:DNA-binding response regulator n=1 Tax=Oceaniferula spumae TaxID=2979115 RepID=A0AAT9FPG9_9BACT
MDNNDSNTPSPVTLWLIEDNAAFRSNLTETLNSVDQIQCTRNFSSCEEALESLQETADRPQVMLIDISLPGMSGIEGLTQILVIDPDIKCIVLTGSDKKQDVFHAICAGASGYLLKNTSIEQIVQSIEDVIEGGASLDPHVASMVLNAFPKSNTPPKQHDLTEREVEVLKHLADGLIIKEISDLMNLSPHTVKFHVANTYKKLNVQSQAGAVAKGIRKGII